MKEKLIKFVYWLVENNDELRTEAIRILAAKDIGVIANVGLHGNYYFRKEGISQQLVVNDDIIAKDAALPDDFLEKYQ